jgi:dynein heavy chain, axonemal
VHETRARAWEKTMMKIQEILEVWVAVQANYLYLEPIFNSEDISKKLPSEAADF